MTSPYGPGGSVYSRKATTPAEQKAKTASQNLQAASQKIQGTLSYQAGVDEFGVPEFSSVDVPEGRLSSFTEAMDVATGTPGYGEMAYQGGALGGFGTQGFIPEGVSAGTIPSDTGGMRVPAEAFRQALTPEQQMQFFEGALPPEPSDVERFQWEAATPEERMERQIALAGQAPPETGIPEFMPGVEPKPAFSAEGGLTPMDSRQAFMQMMEVGARPFDAFAEAAFRSAKAGIMEGEFDNSFFDLLANPNKFVDAETEYIKAFRERPMWAQLAMSLIDPTILWGAATKGSRVASALIRAVSPDDLVQAMAAKGVRPFAQYDMIAHGSTSEFVEQMLRDPTVMDIKGPTRRDYGGGWQPVGQGIVTGEIDLAYKAGVPIEGPARVWPRIQDPTDINYRHAEFGLQAGERQVIVVSEGFPQGRRLTIKAGQAANDAVEEALGKASDQFVVLEGNASRREVIEASGNLQLTAAPVEPSVIPPGPPAALAELPGFTQDNPLVRAQETGNPDAITRGENWIANNPRTQTAQFDRIELPTDDVLRLPGLWGEETWVGQPQHITRIETLADNMRVRGWVDEAGNIAEAITVDIDVNGVAKIMEGNHRIRAAQLAGLDNVPVNIRYHGGSEMASGLWSPTSVERKFAPAPAAGAVTPGETRLFTAGMYAEGPHLGFIPSRHVVKDVAAFATEAITEAERTEMVREFVEQLPREIDTRAADGSTTPTTRFIDSGEAVVAAQRISPESAVSDRLQRPRFVEAAAVAKTGPRLVPVTPPGADPDLFGSLDLFHIMDASSEVGEVVATIEIRRPLTDSSAQVVAFYPTIEGGGAGMFGPNGIKKILEQVGDYYPNLNNLDFDGTTIRPAGSADYFAGSAVDSMAQRLNGMPIADDVANSVNEAYPRMSQADSAKSALDHKGFWPYATNMNGGSKSFSAQLIEMYNPGRGGAGTPTDHAVLGAEQFPRNPDDPMFAVKDWNAHNELFESPGKLKWLVDHMPNTIRGSVSDVVGLWNRVQLELTDPVRGLGHRVNVWKAYEKKRANINLDVWWSGAKESLGFREIVDRKIVDWAKGSQGVWRAENVAGYKPQLVKANPLHGTIDDLMEDLAESRRKQAAGKSYDRRFKLTPQQEKFLQQGMDLQDSLFLEAQKLGIDVGELAEGYWHRVIIRGPQKDTAGAFKSIWNNVLGDAGSRVGPARQSYLYDRAFKNMEEAIAQGFIYDTNPLTRLTARVEAGIDSIAHAHAMDEIMELKDPATGMPFMSRKERLLMKKPDGKYWFANGPRTVKTLDEAKKAHAAAKRIYNRDKSPANETALREAAADEITALRQYRGQSGPGFFEAEIRGMINDASLIDDIKKYIDIPEIQNARQGAALLDDPIWRGVKDVSQLVRSLMTNVDFAAMGIQGHLLMFRDFQSWLTSIAVSMEAFVRKPEAWLAKNKAIIEEGMELGAIMRPTEFLFGSTGISSWPTRIPLAGRAFKGFSRSFEYFIMVGQTELYKVTKAKLTKRPLQTRPGRVGGIMPDRQIIGDMPLQGQAREHMIDLGRAIRRELGTEDYLLLGIRPTQQTFEALTFFAARFMRANLSLIGMAMNPSTSIGTWEARRGLAQLIAGATAITIGAHYAQTGRPPNLTDPYAPDWFQIPVGKTYFNLMGPLYSYFRTIARMTQATIEGDPAKALTQGKNFLNSRAGIPFRAMGITVEMMVNGEATTFEGDKINLSGKGVMHAATEFGAPIAPTSIAEAIKDGRYESIATEVFGLTGRASPFSQMDILFQQHINDPKHAMSLLRQKEGRELGGSYRDASRSEREWMAEHYEDLHAREVAAGSGDFGMANREWDDAKTIAFTDEEQINRQFRMPSKDPNTPMLDGKAYRDAFQRIQAKHWTTVENTNKRLGLFQEERELEDIDDPFEQALHEYHQAYMGSKDAQGKVMWDVAADKLDAFEKKTPPNVMEYIYNNTGLYHTKLGDTLIQDRRDLRVYWDKRDEIIASLIPQERELYEEWDKMTSEQQQMTVGNRFMRVRTKVNTLMSRWMFEQDQAGNEKVGWWEEKLVLWGYDLTPVTDQGSKLRQKLNEDMELTGRVREPRKREQVTTSTPPPAPTGPQTPPWVNLRGGGALTGTPLTPQPVGR